MNKPTKRYKAFMRTDDGHWYGFNEANTLEEIWEWYLENRDFIHKCGYTVSRYVIEDRQTGERKDVIK